MEAINKKYDDDANVKIDQTGGEKTEQIYIHGQKEN